MEFFFFALFPLLFVGTWLLIVGHLGNTAWKHLVNLYPATEQPNGKKINGVSGIINKSRYNNSLILHLTQDGFYMSNFILFQYRHPPLFIPWSGIEKMEKKKNLVSETIELYIKADVPAKIWLNNQKFGKIKADLPHKKMDA